MAQHHELVRQFTLLLEKISPRDVGWDFIHDFLKDWQLKGKSYLVDVRNSILYHEALLKVLKALHEEHDLAKLLLVILDKAIELTGAERGFLFAEGKEIGRTFHKEDIIESENAISHTIADQVRNKGEPILEENARYAEEWRTSESIQNYQLVSILCVPIRQNGQIIGILYLDNRIQRACFKETELRLLLAFSEQAALALHNAKLYEETLHQTKELQFSNDVLNSTIKEKNAELATANNKIRQHQGIYFNIRSRNPQMHKIFSMIERIKDSDLPVLIQGESGTGKELIARAIHLSGRYKTKPFVDQNCAAIPSSLLGDALFGHEKGAFTGANEKSEGIFERADGGIVFLDEIGELNADAQAALLRILGEKNPTIRRLGSGPDVSISFRLIAATNRNLAKMVENGTFREDLFYRLNVLSIKIPPLRKRKEDIRGLIKTFLSERTPRLPIESGVLAVLMNYDWPGNVRQLQGEISRLCTISDQVIRVQDISPEILTKTHFVKDAQEMPENIPLKQAVADFERAFILKIMEANGNNLTKTFESLQVCRHTLKRKLIRYGFRDIDQEDMEIEKLVKNDNASTQQQ